MSLKGQKRLIARAAMVSGIVTDAASLLRAIHRLDGCIQVENRILQRLHEAGDDVIVDLGQGQDARFVVEAVQSSVQRVVVRELVQAQLQAKQRVMLKLVDVYDAFASERIDRDERFQLVGKGEGSVSRRLEGPALDMPTNPPAAEQHHQESGATHGGKDWA